MRFKLKELVELLFHRWKKDTYDGLDDWETADSITNVTETVESESDDSEVIEGVIDFYNRNKETKGIKKTLQEIGIYDVLFRLYSACEINDISPKETIERICCTGKHESTGNNMGLISYLTGSDFPLLTKMMFDDGAISENYYKELIAVYPRMRNKVMGTNPSKKKYSTKPADSKVTNLSDYMKK
ncbi:hypothetical protein HOC35_07025 [Candidatus Woesearchaeota archaeon]|jgi:hypothetical protein|nr:hypothetical protein [Candidatus Woesearchaeota archaeon]